MGEQDRKGLHHLLGGYGSFHHYREALPAILVHDRHHLQSAFILRSVHDEVVAPHVVLVLGAPSRTSVLVGIEKVPPLALSAGHFESHFFSEPVHPLL